ncbi:MAG TPA: hypothetical protein HPP97_05270 [Desulfuromonadales bacterium]|nr:hypothetical protein [Desulfuromonadales bacterium]
MRKKIIVVTEETKLTGLFILSLLVVLLVMVIVSYFLQERPTADREEDEQNTVVIMKAKKEQIRQKKARQSVVSSVRDAIKKGNSLTPYMQIGNMDTNSPEYKELKKMLEDESKRRKAGGVRKEATDSKKIIRYIDESTPRDRSSDAAYIYFVDVSTVLIPRFCVQIALQQHLQMTEITITADSKTMSLKVPSYESKNIEKGVAEWYDVPLDQDTYRAVQAIMKAKKAVLSINGLKGKVSRDLTEDEIKAFRRILDGYTALGGSLNYLQVDSPSNRK